MERPLNVFLCRIVRTLLPPATGRQPAHYRSGMPLRPGPEASHAAWFATSKAPWTQLCTLGPSGFEKYGRLFHPLREGADEYDPDELVNVEGHLDDSHLKRLLEILARHTSTPDDCFLGLWDGFGDLYGSPAVSFFHTGPGKGPDVLPAFPAEFLNGPRVEIPNRSYLLFRGPLSEAGRWGAADLAPGHPRPINSPNLMWPPRPCMVRGQRDRCSLDRCRRQRRAP